MIVPGNRQILTTLYKTHIEGCLAFALVTVRSDSFAYIFIIQWIISEYRTWGCIYKGAKIIGSIRKLKFHGLTRQLSQIICRSQKVLLADPHLADQSARLPSDSVINQLFKCSRRLLLSVYPPENKDIVGTSGHDDMIAIQKYEVMGI